MPIVVPSFGPPGFIGWWPRSMRKTASTATIMLIALTACSPRVPKPTSDSTAPVLEWTAHNNDTKISQTFTGSGSVQASRGDSFLVTLKAKDPEGVMEVTISRSVGWSCSSGNIGQQSGPSLGVTEKTTGSVDAEGKVPTELFMIRDADLGPYNCQSGFTFDDASETFTGSGTNWLNGKTQGSLTFTVQP